MLIAQLTIEESDAILALLLELPIKYLPIVQAVQNALKEKFVQAQAALEISETLLGAK